MKNNILNKLFTLILLYVLLYVGAFICLHFMMPNLGSINININPNEYNPELQQINITAPQIENKYYILIYEEAEQDNWLYFNTKTYIKPSELFLSEFLSNFKNKYILLEGNQFKSNFSFDIKSKYPISYMANKESKFHLFYIIPYKFFIFPTFYYSKHFIFFINPIM